MKAKGLRGVKGDLILDLGVLKEGLQRGLKAFKGSRA